MQRLWVRWALLVVFVAVLGTVFVNLGGWQLDRLAQRQVRNTSTIANERAPIRPAAEIFTRPIAEADQWQRASVSGTFDPAHQFVVRYRENNDTSGYEVVTPLQTSFGTLLVDRGFIPLARGTAIPSTAPAPPSGPVTVTGHVRRSENGRAGAVQPVNGQVRLISSAALQSVLPYPVVDGYLGLVTITPAQSGGFQPVALPELSEGPALLVRGAVVHVRRHRRARHRGVHPRRHPRAAAGPRAGRGRPGGGPGSRPGRSLTRMSAVPGSRSWTWG